MPSACTLDTSGMLSRLLDLAVAIAMDTALLEEVEAKETWRPTDQDDDAPGQRPQLSRHSALDMVRSVVQQMSYEDLAPTCRLESLHQEGSAWPSSAPHGGVRFFDVLVHFDVSVSLITLEPGACIPLHDHSGLWGFSKLLVGELQITKFDIAQPLPPRAFRIGAHVDVCNRCIMTLPVGDVDELTPTAGNIHSITNHGAATAVWLYVLLPPYQDDASCHYFVASEFEDRLLVVEDSRAWGPLKH